MQSKTDSEQPGSPFRRLPFILGFARFAVRWVRMFKIKCLNPGKVTVGRNVSVGPGANVMVPDSMKIADNVGIGADFISQTNVTIGEECLLSSRVSFIGHDHDLEGGQSAFFSGRTRPSNTVLEGDNFIGFGATLCGNVTLGRGAIVGAHSLVMHSVPANTVVAGVPARVIGGRKSP